MISFMMFASEEGHDVAYFNVMEYTKNKRNECLGHRVIGTSEATALLSINHTEDRDISVDSKFGDKFTEYHFQPNKNERAMLLLKYLN